jgi:glycolate oxidase iron-sulfur subunit
MLVLDGCVQPAMAPNINAATARVLDALGVQLVVAPKAGCCGAVRFHLNDQDAGLDDMRRNIDAWWPYVDSGAGRSDRDDGVRLRRHGQGIRPPAGARPGYAAKAARISALTRDLSESCCRLRGRARRAHGRPHPGARGLPPALHAAARPADPRQGRRACCAPAGVDVVLCADSHLCCGSAGTYSVLQPEIAHAAARPQARQPASDRRGEIVSANIGCITHLQSGTATPVTHWIELVDRASV